MTSLKWRALVYGTFLAACGVAIWPPFERHGVPGKLRLGLDLRGGTHLVLQVLPDRPSSGGPRPVAPETLSEVMRTVERRVNQLGVAEPVVTEYGTSGDRILVQLPGMRDVERARRLLTSVARLSLHLVRDAAPTCEGLAARMLEDPSPSVVVLEGRGDAPAATACYLLQRDAVVTGRDLKSAHAGRDELDRPTVRFALEARGAEALERETTRHVGRRLAIVLDDRVVSAPTIDGVVGSEGQIRGGLTSADAAELALLLRSGALPAGLRSLHQVTVGASLGQDSVRAGIAASAAAAVSIAAFLLARYRLAGVNALVALLANVLVLLAAMVMLDATLTLPGIAGIVLTLGVGVDTNVLVFERIREEVRLGRTAHAAVHAAFARVWVTVLDTHATALIAAAFLFQFGSGPVKGFAVTLVIGLLANVFASWFVSKLLFEWVLARRGASPLSI